ncbi:GNAT family N-acetyltransferase [Aestuariimicrobium soli]|uniref:GNAT family N-acetyltransferase n=1 Tax=Aestuariimicrobium soli TaxID=2035834 RepID=UPI003EBE7965
MLTWTIRSLGPETQAAYSALVAEHPATTRGASTQGGVHRHDDERARAALVFDPDGTCLGWAQYGSPDEVPVVKHRRTYEAHAEESEAPDWRLCCVFVGSRFRRLGVARAAVEGALDLIADEGGGLVEAISEVTHDREVDPRSLVTATVELFERHGFERVRQVGRHAWVVQRRLEPARAAGRVLDVGIDPSSRVVDAWRGHAGVIEAVEARRPE